MWVRSVASVCAPDGRDLGVEEPVAGMVRVGDRVAAPVTCNVAEQLELVFGPKVLEVCEPAVQFALLAGIRALQRSGLLGEDFKLLEGERDETAVLYVTSFPALDSARHLDIGDRKLLFRLLVLANAQLAQRIEARGPNLQLSAACAGSTSALSTAQDLLGRVRNVVLIAGDDAAGGLFGVLGPGFSNLGALYEGTDPWLAAHPWDQRRAGVVLGSGGVGLVLSRERGDSKVRLVHASNYNSCYHACSMHAPHLGTSLARFLREAHVDPEDIRQRGFYMSHETSSNASHTHSCAYNEASMLEHVFGERAPPVASSKCFTGHGMGVSFEDVLCVRMLQEGRAFGLLDPASEMDPRLNLTLLPEGPTDKTLALRFSAGFGSQVAFALFQLEP